ncbi:MAG: type II toxin-antitoxin system RelE/ParE family toxin [Nevskiales bacterium]
MARLTYAKGALVDLERVADFLLESDPAAAPAIIDLIVEAVEVLANHPLIGRPVEEGLRELVVSRGHSGYIALYSYETVDDAVLILAVRHQREAGHPDDAGQ